MLQPGVPFTERGGTLRGCLDLISGRFPRFLFGGAVGANVLPVFHFHDVTRADLEPRLRYLADNGYRTIDADEIERFVTGRSAAGEHRVALCFDDAWASIWTVAAPLLKQYGLRAIVYAIPARIEEADACRPQETPTTSPMTAVTTAGPPFVTWPELRALHASGAVDVQCHTHTHSRVFTSAELIGFVTPKDAPMPLLNRPQVDPPPHLRFVTDADLGAPLFPARSRMSDGPRVAFTSDVHKQCVERVASEGGAAFFERSDWRARLAPIVASTQSRVESGAEQGRAIEEELDCGRAILNDRLGTTSVNHVCLPWGVSGARTAEALARLGFRTAFANRLRGVHAVRRGDHPHWLKRLPNKYIFRLPGRGRRAWS